MQTEVLRFIHYDYEVIVRTQDISYSWERFKGRIRYSKEKNPSIDAPDAYCRYTSKDECQLRLYSPITFGTILLEYGKEWDKKWPVVFETCKYQVRLLFHKVDAGSMPEIRHIRKDIEDSFYYDEELNGKEEKSLTGELYFMNEPGVFKLDFSYYKNGVRKESFVTFDVVSPKLDTKNDYKSLLREVNEEYENVIYRYLSITLQQFSRGKLNTDATWTTDKDFYMGVFPWTNYQYWYVFDLYDPSARSPEQQDLRSRPLGLVHDIRGSADQTTPPPQQAIQGQWYVIRWDEDFPPSYLPCSVPHKKSFLKDIDRCGLIIRIHSGNCQNTHFSNQ